MDQSVAPLFVRHIAKNLALWQTRVAAYKAANAFEQFEAEQDNLRRAVEFGLGLEQTWPAATKLLLDLFVFIAGYGYGRMWMPLLEKGVECCSSRDDVLTCRLLNRLGELHRLERRFPIALAYHERALALAEQRGDEHALARACHFLSAANYLLQDYNQADRYARRSLELFGRLGDRTGIARARHALGGHALERAQLEEAEEQLQAAAAIFEDINHPINLGRVLNDLGRLYQEKQQFDAALAYYERALQTRQSVVDKTDEAMMLTNIGSLYYNKGLYQKAETAFRKVDVDYLRRVGNIYYHALTLNGIGHALWEQNKLTRAELYLRQSIDLWRKTEYNVMLANTLGTYGDLLVAREEIREACAVYAEAIGLLDKESENAFSRNLYAELGQKRDEHCL